MGRRPRRWCAARGIGLLALVLDTVIMVPGMAYYTGNPAVDGAATRPSARKCWLFTHMNKSGGSSIKGYLEKWIRRRGAAATHGLYDSQEWANGMRPYAQRILRQNNTITWGGYTEGLRPYGAQDCKWFTMFRHPISRLVSAYYFCLQHPEDQLCATEARTGSNEDLVGFARHWGNYGLMQFVLAFVKPEDIVPDEKFWAATPKNRVCLKPFIRDNPNPQGCPGWYRLKLFVESRSTPRTDRAGVGESGFEGTVPPLNQQWMHQFLQPVMNMLSEKYAAVGIMGRWDASMQLFQSALELPGMDWMAAFKTSGKLNTLSEFELEREETLRRAWRDPDIRDLLWLDILLYDHAVSVFNKQAEAYGIVTATIL